ncbi:GHKL domain-containing protein [Anoxynatronum buryatiense]|uniref:GHKL domain-containing protein n=1 Tax=Anoxynatronum buryatiense TaxID=489973 RepID=UPI0024B69DC2|nr:sensor histidine kinase [Anoxynatronum buryatiense]
MKTEIVSYVLFHVMIGIIYFVLNLPWLTMLSNLAGILLLTMNYESNLRKKILTTLQIYLITMLGETVTVLFLRQMMADFQPVGINYELILSYFISKLVIYMFVLVLGNLRQIKHHEPIKNAHWFAVFLIPLGSILITYIVVINIYLENEIAAFMAISVIMTINVLVFYLYDEIIQFNRHLLEKTVLQNQNLALLQQLSLFEESQSRLNAFKHDLKQHLGTMQVMVQNEEHDMVSDYLNELNEQMNQVDGYVSTGNAGLDSVINLKINEAKNKGIEINYRIQVPEDLSFKPLDISVIMGNLLDNAIEATQLVQQERQIILIIEWSKKCLFIQVENPYDEPIKYSDEGRLISHKNVAGHGIGLQNVRQTLEKYNGTLEVNHRNQKFSVAAILYL